MSKRRPWWRTLLTWGVIAVVVYFGNVQIQTMLGRRALASLELEVHGLDEGLAEAARSDRLVLADVSAIWCSSCRTFDRRVLSDPAVREAIDERFVFVRVEYESEEGEAFRERYGVKGFPAVLVLRPDGELVGKLPIAYDPAVFRTTLSGV